MTVKQLLELMKGVPDDHVVVAAGTDGPKASLAGAARHPEDGRVVLFLEHRRDGERRDVAICLTEGRGW